jgi:hypothetical protein
MAVISVRAAGDLPIISDYMPLIGLYFLLSMLYTFLSLIWFAACNSLRTNSSLPIFVNRLALKIKRVKQSVLMVFRMKVDMSMYQISKEKENNDLISILNNIAFFFMFMAMFVTYLTIWLKISN